MTRPVVLVIGGLDPSGGAGLGADIQAASVLGAHPAPVATLVTVQDTSGVKRVEPLAPELVVAQARAVLGDMKVGAVKLGALGTSAIGEALAGLLEGVRAGPVVIDPVLAASGGGRLADAGLCEVYRNRLLPLARVATPNHSEFDALGGETAFAVLFERGLGACIVTGGDAAGTRVRHLVIQRGSRREFDAGPRLAGDFHGTGCTFATALAARLAGGDSLDAALAAAEEFVRRALTQAFRPGRGRALPGRW